MSLFAVHLIVCQNDSAHNEHFNYVVIYSVLISNLAATS